jgi:hypothetical protein
LSDGDDSPIAVKEPPLTGTPSPLQDGLNLLAEYVATLPWMELQSVIVEKTKPFINDFYTHC